MGNKDETDPLRDMTKHGWRKALTWQDIKQRPNGSWTLSEVDFDTKALHCEGCGTNEYLWVVPQRAGVFLACVMCETVDGPISMEFGDLISTRQATPLEVLQILEQRGLEVPRSLRKAVGKRISRVRRGARPKDKF
jgi:hypothetical protein